MAKAARLISGCNALGEVQGFISSLSSSSLAWLHGDSGCNAIGKVVGGLCVVKMWDYVHNARGDFASD